MEPHLTLAQWAQGQSDADRGHGNAPSAFSQHAHCYRFSHSSVIVAKLEQLSYQGTNTGLGVRKPHFQPCLYCLLLRDLWELSLPVWVSASSFINEANVTSQRFVRIG